MHIKIYPLILVVCSGTALSQQLFDSGQNLQDNFDPYSKIPQDIWPRYKGQLVDPRCIITNLGKKHQKREWPRLPQPEYPVPGFCPAWQQNTETETDHEDRNLCGEGFEPRCCAGKAFGFGLGTVRSPCYQYMTAVHCKNQYNGETYCCEIFLAFPLDGTYGFNCRPVTFASIPTFHASSSSPYALLEIPFANTKTSPDTPFDASSNQESFNSATAAAADWTADSSSNNYINNADAWNADLVGNEDSEVIPNPFLVN